MEKNTQDSFKRVLLWADNANTIGYAGDGGGLDEHEDLGDVTAAGLHTLTWRSAA